MNWATLLLIAWLNMQITEESRSQCRYQGGATLNVSGLCPLNGWMDTDVWSRWSLMESRPVSDTFADSTNVCFQHPSNIIPVSYQPIPKQSPPASTPDNHSCYRISALSPSSLATDDTRRFSPACFCLALYSCRGTTPSALSAITEKTEEAVAWFSRLWRLSLSIIFLPVMIYAACVNAHVCASHVPSFLFLLVCISGSFSPHANISSLLLSVAPDLKVHNTRCFYTHWLRVLKSWLHDLKMKAKTVLDRLHAALVK